MRLEVGKEYNGFLLKEENKIEEINSISRVFYHEKSGARLLHLENDDDNKVFSISFRTPPKDSTGVAHILEHSVLCGSRKFPVKEPFVELIKGSLNTFLNAMTFADKTMYPVASKNDRDFQNLMDVYLDAVLYPNIYKFPEIMMQEGWHYEIEDKNDDITYKGVVYNEMKGAFSSPESVLVRRIQGTLFPDTAYGVVSGGDPEEIPNLTQEAFEGFHKKYYHPSNSYIFLYGDLDILEQLKFINENYLMNFDKIEVDSEIEFQKPFNCQKEERLEYSISEDEKEEDKTYLSLNYAVGVSTNPEEYLAFEILEHILLGAQSAPLKRAIIDANLGKDVFGYYDNSIYQPVFSVIVKNSNESEKERFKQVVYDTLRKLVNEGIDKKLIEASINIKEFQLREADYDGDPKGLIYNIKAMDSWLYDGDANIHLEYNKYFKKVREGLKTRYFEELIEKYILNNTHSSFLVLSPKQGLAEQKAKETERKLKDYKNSLSEQEIGNLIEQTKALKLRQNTPDSEESLETIPMLSIEDIKNTVEDLPLVDEELRGVKVLRHPMFTNSIAYVHLYFDSSAVEQPLIPYISLLSTLLGSVDTKNYNYGDLSNEVNINTGGIRFHSKAIVKNKDAETYYPKVVVKGKALVCKLPELLTLTAEILSSSKFDDKNRLREILDRSKSRIEMYVNDAGHVVSSGRALSYISSCSKYEEILSGLSYYKFIVELIENFDKKSDEIINNLKKISNCIFNKKNLMVSVTFSDEDYKEFEKNFNILFDSLGDEFFQPQAYRFDLGKENEGLMTSAEVQYVAKASNFIKLGYDYSGNMRVLKTIVGLDYLWNRVRVQGGAYGCFLRFSRSGNVYLGSYRDPNLVETVEAYNQMEAYIREFTASEREMTKYIIGTISELDTPQTPVMKGEHAVLNYISGITKEDMKRERIEILNTKEADIRKYSELFDKAMKENYLCVLGNQEKIKENEKLFNKLINVFE